MSAIVRLAHIAEKIDDPEQRPRFDRRIHHLGETIADDLPQPVAQRGAALLQLGKVIARDGIHQPRIPRLDLVSQPASRSRPSDTVIGMR